MRKILTRLQYGICSVILLWGMIDCIIGFIGLLTHPGWSAPLYAPFLWFLVFYLAPAAILFFVFALIKYFMKKNKEKVAVVPKIQNLQRLF